MNLAPIILFVYNRPWHTEQTLNALALNSLAQNSVLFIYADGPKENTTPEARFAIEETRKIIRKKKWCREVTIVEAEKNKGLANSVIDGITSILKENDRVIVMEDDLVTARGFLEFINQGLEQYADKENVAGISGWSFPIKVKQETYFSRIGACWGWATWKRVWNKTNLDASGLINDLKRKALVNEFNADGSYDYFAMLLKQESKSIDSWAIRFYASYFLNKGLFLFPQTSLVENIGFDGSGTHYKEENKYIVKPFENEFIKIKSIDVQERPITRKKIITFFLGQKNPGDSVIKRVILKIKNRF